MSKKPEGWKNKRPDDPARHADAARGIKTGNSLSKMPRRVVQITAKNKTAALGKAKEMAHKDEVVEGVYRVGSVAIKAYDMRTYMVHFGIDD